MKLSEYIQIKFSLAYESKIIKDGSNGREWLLKKTVDDLSISSAIVYSNNAIYVITVSKSTLNSSNFIKSLSKLSFTQLNKFETSLLIAQFSSWTTSLCIHQTL